MKLAIKAYVVALMLLTSVFMVSAQQRSESDDRNTAPTVGTGGPVGGPTGLFTVYDGQTLRKGEFTFSIAYSNYDRDPGDVDISSIPLSFQIGVTDNLEFFFGTEAYRGVKVNSPRNLSGFYLPNAQINGFTPPAVVIGASGPFANTALFRPTALCCVPFSSFNTLGTPRDGGGGADIFPGIGSAFGGILPGIVLTSVFVDPNPDGTGGGGTSEVPGFFTVAPSYLGDAPFISRQWGTSTFNSLDFGVKWRFNDVEDAIGYGLIASYRYYLDRAEDDFNMLQRGSGPGASKGDINLTFFADARLAEWANLSGNIGYTYTTNPELGGFTLLDRGDELLASVGVDFPVNKHLQFIGEFRSLQYVGGRTPNAFERDPIDGIAGIRVFPRRWWGFGAAYRANLNQQDTNSFNQDDVRTFQTVNTDGTPTTVTFRGAPPGFRVSTSPSGFIGQLWFGRRDDRLGAVVNQVANVESVALSTTVITLPCPPGTRPREGSVCDDNRTISVATRAVDPENDVLTYNYTVSGGRINGSGANVTWDLSGAQPGTYTITTGVNDGCGVCGRTNTQTITVRECDCVPACVCPTISVSGPSGLTPRNQSMTFTATVVGGDVTYNWTVSSGSISSGQGTPTITVDTVGLAPGSNVTATVDIGNLPPGCNCPSSDSATGSIAPEEGPIPVDDFGALVDDEVKARVDNFFLQLNQNPNAQGYIINYGTPAQIRARRAQILRAINRPGTGYDASRVTFVDGPDTGDGVRTRFIIVPPGVTPPAP